MGEENSRAYDNMPLWMKRRNVYNSIALKNPESSLDFRKYWDNEPAELLDGQGNTLIHLLVICNNEDALKFLMDNGYVTQEHLKKQNLRGETALHEAARHDNVGIVQLLLEKEMKLISMLSCSSVPMCNCTKCTEAMLAKKESSGYVRNELGETALFLAAACGKWKIFHEILKYNNEDCTTQRKDGCTVLHAAIMVEHYLTASRILRLNPVLAQKYNKAGNTALYLLASSPSSFSSYSFYTAATMAKSSFIPLQSSRVLFLRCIPHMYTVTKSSGDEEDPDGSWKTYIVERKRNTFVNRFLGLPWIQSIYYTKRKNILAVGLAKQLLEEEVDWSRYTDFAHKNHDQSETSDKTPLNPLIQAIKMGIPELVEEILWYFPGAANSIDKDGRNVFHYAAEHKGGDIFEKLKECVIDKDRMLSDLDYQGNTILHHAVKPKPATNFSLGIANLMAWDVFWFQRMRHDCPPHLMHVRNNDGITAEYLLLEYYKYKREAAEKAVKEMNQGLMVVAALIVTVSFAALFTLPGGYDQSNGTPLLFKKENKHHRDLNLYLRFVGLTFFASLIALGTLLSTQLSRFHFNDLYLALPLKYSIAILCLFLSSCSIYATFLQALVLMDCLPDYYFTTLAIGCIIMGLVYVNSMYHVLSYIAEVLRHLNTDKRHEYS